MEQEAHERSLITWVIVLGVLLVIVVGASGYVIANPEGLYRLFGGKVPTTVQPITTVNGPAPVLPVRAANTKHYENIFFEFDYPENFVITDELVNATRTSSGDTLEVFGSANVILTATGTDGAFTIRVFSEVNADHTGVAEASAQAKEAFSTREGRGANDSFQDITIVSRAAYKYFSDGHIHLGIPTLNLNYSAEITWDTQSGVRSTANNYLGVLEDSFIVK